MTCEEIVTITCSIINCLTALKEFGIYHRDIKPANILFK